jgi:nucleoside-diphosphate-sugar epimerase
LTGATKGLKVLLTGASGFVGSHILDSLQARQIPTAILLRPTSDKTFLQPHLHTIEIRAGTISDPASLRAAMQGITHVIHCAGLTRVRKPAEFYEGNQIGTRNVVAAINNQSGLQRLVHVSSLAAFGPAVPANPAREDQPEHPVSEYGKSKLAAEHEVHEHCRIPFVILRPTAVYGPRDYGFLPLFRAISRHLLPLPANHQALSLVFVNDLAEAVVRSLDNSSIVGKTCFVSNREVVTGRQMAQEISTQLKRWTAPCPLPLPLLWAGCIFNEGLARITGKPGLLNLQKFAELKAPGWVCDPSALHQALGWECPTTLKTGITETLKWYSDHKWI